VKRERGTFIVELAGVFVGLAVLPVILGAAFIVEGPRGAEMAMKNFCEQKLQGKWLPNGQTVNGDSCPGGSWENVFAQPKQSKESPAQERREAIKEIIKDRRDEAPKK
jgi:hypothetical protein